MTTIKLDPGAALLLDALHGAGHAAYAVGGCVRDSLLGLAPHDWDLCTSARPEQVMALFGELNKEGRTIIMITHDAHIAAYAHRTVNVLDGVLSEGGIGYA